MLSLIALQNGEKLSTITEVEGSTFYALEVFRTSKGVVQLDVLTDRGLQTFAQATLRD